MPRHHCTLVAIIPLVLSLLCACGSLKSIPDGQYSVEKVAVECDNHDIDASLLVEYARQKPNAKVFALFRKAHEKPVIYDSLLAQQSANDITTAVRNAGYLHANTTIRNTIRGKKLRTTFLVTANEPYYISRFNTHILDPAIDSLLAKHTELYASLQRGRPFSVYTLNSLRNSITALLNDNGYYKFNKDFIDYSVDTLSLSTAVGIDLTLYPYRANSVAPEQPHRQYTIRNINYITTDEGKVTIRRRVLHNSTALQEGQTYSTALLRRTYNNFSHLPAIKYTNISFSEVADTTLLDCNITFSTNKPSSISIQPEGTNTAGDFGAALILAYNNNNIFHGSELLSLQVRGAFEAIRGLEGYADEDYQEYSFEGKLTFPRFVVPSRRIRRHAKNTITSNSTELAISYNLQNRPEFHRRLFAASWRYRWANTTQGTIYRLDLLDLNYIYMPWISETFREDYLDNNESRNAILRYNYEDLFIMKIGFGISVSKKNYSYRANIETAGNFLHTLATITRFPKNNDNQYTLFHIAYAQYVKGDFEYTHNFTFDDNNSLAIHGAIGIAYPYGNSSILPFEKRYFSGGANSVRGWSVRSLGPGRFHGKDGRIDFINQTGDIKLDLNAEYRTKLFWKFYGAIFIDAGNVWTIRHYDDQDGGQFKITEFYKQLAAAYGLGIRLHLGYFILRFDFGMKAINPDYTTKKQHYPIYHPRLDRDLAIHFAVGLPF